MHCIKMPHDIDISSELAQRARPRFFSQLRFDRIQKKNNLLVYEQPLAGNSPCVKKQQIVRGVQRAMAERNNLAQGEGRCERM
jgi:hypothetical protein